MLMITLILHITTALLSLLMATLLIIKPSYKAIIAENVLVVTTLISGTYLVISTSQGLVSACLSGFVFLAITLTSIRFADIKLNS